jgi:hypothetical protein
LEDYKRILAATTNILTIEARAKDIKEIVFFTIRAKAKKDAKKKCEDKNKEKKRSKRFKVGE